MNPEKLLIQLRALGATLTADGDRLRIDAPRGSLGPELHAAIREHKPALIQLLHAEGSAPPESSNPRSASTDPYPLALAQERIWLFQELNPDSTTYLLSPLVQIEGPLDPARLEATLRTLVLRHEPLRSMVDGEGEDARLRPADLPDTLIAGEDLSALSASEQAEAIRQIVQREQERPVHLRHELPLRATLIRRGPEAHDLLTVFHHLAADGFSFQVFYRELAAVYSGHTLPALDLTYRDYSVSDRARWEKHKGAELKFWGDYLRDAPMVLDLPTDAPRPPTMTATGGLITHELPTSDLPRILALAQQEGASLFMAMLAAFAAALHRHSGQRDLIIGTPVHGRNRAEFRHVMGMFVNQVAIRLQVRPKTTFRELIRLARETALAALSHHETPFSAVAQAFDNHRDRGRTPVFQALLNVYPAPLAAGSALELGPARLTIPNLSGLFDGQAKFDLTLYAGQREGALKLDLVYNSDVFHRPRMASLVEVLSTLLSRGSEQPDTPLDTLFAGPDRRLVPAPKVVPGSVTEWFNAIATKMPARTAVSGPRVELTYSELQAAAGRIASLVAHALANTTDAVGVFVPHDGRIPQTLLGVLMSGHPYVPLDPRYPDERLRYMAEDARLSALVTVGELTGRATALFGGKVRVLDIADQSSGSSLTPSAPAPDAPAYYLYTSGSTGRPKAVVQSHRNLQYQAGRYAEALKFEPTDRLALLASISFDASLMDLFGAVAAGAAIEPIDLRAMELADLPALLEQRRLTVLHVTPSVFRALAQSAPAAAYPTIRAVVLGGEAVSLEDVKFFHRAFRADAVLLNLYGASEHSFALGSFLDRTQRDKEVPIGFPVGDVEPVLLDTAGEVDAVRGELALRSAQGALHYWNAPEQNALRFIPDPEHPGRTLYRTGDVVWRRPDGAYVFLHRADNQVKVRGHRVEPLEIESVLRPHPRLAEVAVHAPVGPDGAPTLTACVVPREGESLHGAELAAWCRERLPDYLVPGAWVIVDHLPRTPSGKINRRALPVRDTSAIAPDLEPPQTPVEATVARIFGAALGREQVGRHENFFDLGGHSLLAMRLIAQLRAAFTPDLPLRSLFDAPTVAEFAGQLFHDAATNTYTYANRHQRWKCLVPAQPKGARPPLFLITGYMDADDTWRILSNLVPQLGLDQPLYGLRPRWLDGTSAPYASVTEAANEYLSELQAFQPHGPYYLGGDCVGGVLAVEIARALLQQGEKVGLLMLMDTERPTAFSATFANVRLAWRRVLHMGEVVRQLWRPTEGTRRQIIAGVLQRKVRKIRPVEAEVTVADRIRDHRVGYRRLMYRHRVQPFPGPLTVIVSEAMHRIAGDLGWKAVARGGLEVYSTPGDHWTIRTEHSRQLGERVRTCLEAAQRRHEPRAAIAAKNPGTAAATKPEECAC